MSDTTRTLRAQLDDRGLPPVGRLVIPAATVLCSALLVAESAGWGWGSLAGLAGLAILAATTPAWFAAVMETRASEARERRAYAHSRVEAGVRTPLGPPAAPADPGVSARGKLAASVVFALTATGLLWMALGGWLVAQDPGGMLFLPVALGYTVMGIYRSTDAWRESVAKAAAEIAAEATAEGVLDAAE